MRHARLFASATVALLASTLGSLPAAHADEPPAPAIAPASEAPVDEPRADVMHILAAHGLHDLHDERYNVYGQISLIGHGKAPFAARYTNLGGTTKSLLPTSEGSWTGTATVFMAARLWPGGEAYLVPEVVSERPFSGLSGLGGAIQNAELQKSGGAAPTIYLSRVYLRQTVGLGGGKIEKGSEAMQLGATVDARRLVLTVGKLSPLDLFDKNAFTSDVRKQFVSLAFMTHAAWDFATDARGYTWGAAAELYLGEWALRLMHTTVPKNPNDLTIDFRFWKYFGDQLELEHTHELHHWPGSVKLLGYRNLENMGRFDDAVLAQQIDPRKNAATCTGFHYDSTNATAPDLCWARRPNTKIGVGLNLEQAIGDSLGVFVRGMYSDGQTEVYAYMPADRSLSFGALARGSWWKRPRDLLGAAFGASWISRAHADYLGRGGVDGFIGDGKITQAAETTFELVYSVRVLDPLWLSADYQHVIHPAYNADRGPVDIGGARLHVEL
jgi:hypothetical protein